MNIISKTTFFMAYSFVVSSETTNHNTIIFVFKTFVLGPEIYSGDKNCDFTEIKVR